MSEQPTQSDNHQQPIMVLPKGALSVEDIQRLRDNGVCCVEADEPDAIRFVDPPVDLSVIDRSAGEVFRMLLERPDRTESWNVRELVDYLARAIASRVPREIRPVKKVKRKPAS